MKNMTYLHADDLGLSKGITAGILATIDAGSLNSVSVVPNGYAVDEAVEELKKRPGIRRVVHLNFVEGKPVGDAGSLAMILDKNGEFRMSFLALWTKYLFGSQKQKSELKAGVKAEIRAQVAEIARRFDSTDGVNIDSHQHYHMIPFVFDALMELRDELNIKYIRMPREPFFVHFDSWLSIGNYFGENIVKHILLNALSSHCIKRLGKTSINYNDYLIGILFSGNMTLAAARKGVSKAARRGVKHSVEVVFHPGGGAEDEKKYWLDRPVNDRFYYSSWRAIELKELTARPALQELG